MGGSGGGSYRQWRSESLKDAVRQDANIAATQFESKLADLLSDLLATYNSRDADLVRRRLDAAKSALQDELETTLDQLLGGSVAKRTYVDGLSDVDSLLVVNGSRFEESSPPSILARMERILRERLPKEIDIGHGDMAVTLTYPDGMSVQLLPAIRTEQGLNVPAAGKSGWSEINPERFREALTRRNEECAGKLVPTIKLAKAVIGLIPEQYRLTGYHVESLAIAAFAGYEGTKTSASMLPYFFERAKELVRSPIKDRTGQSIHVDEYLGPENSDVRRTTSHLLGQLAKRMRNASAAQSKDQWQSLFFADD